MIERVVWDYRGSDQGPVYFNDQAAPKLAPGQAFARASCHDEALLTLGIGKIGRPGPRPIPTPYLAASMECNQETGEIAVPFVGRAVGGEDVLIIDWAGAEAEGVAYDVQIVQYGW